MKSVCAATNCNPWTPRELTERADIRAREEGVRETLYHVVRTLRFGGVPALTQEQCDRCEAWLAAATVEVD